MPLRTDEVLQDEPNPGPPVALARELYPLIIDALRPACSEQLTRGHQSMLPNGVLCRSKIGIWLLTWASLDC